MKQISRMAVPLIGCFVLSGCIGEGLCESYREIPEPDRNEDGKADYRYQVIGDSILAYNQFSCMSVGHYLGFNVNDRVQTRAITGAMLGSIHNQYKPPIDEASDNDYLIVNGGLNDLIAGNNFDSQTEPTCDCNGLPDHDICLGMVDELTDRMAGFIDNVQTQSSADVVLVSYYPAETSSSFIGDCFPYVERLNQKYHDLAQTDPSVHYVQTYGPGIDPVVKVNNMFGRDQYHPTPTGSEQIATQIVEQLGLVGMPE